MKRFTDIILLILSLAQLLSCDSDYSRIEKRVVKQQIEQMVISGLDVSCRLERGECSNEYQGYLIVSSLGEEIQLPITVERHGFKIITYHNVDSREELQEMLDGFLSRLEEIKAINREKKPGIETCDCWGWVKDYLCGDLLREYERLDDTWRDCLSSYIESNYAVYPMQRCNEYAMNFIKPFLNKIGTNPAVFESVLITESDRQNSQERLNAWTREYIKKARNTWVDNNPQEARRRGIMKF